MNPVRHNGIDYPSQTALAKALGVRDASVYGALRRGSIDKLGTGPGRPRSCEWEGVTYPSRNAAAAALGICRSTFQNWRKKMDATE